MADWADEEAMEVARKLGGATVYAHRIAAALRAAEARGRAQERERAERCIRGFFSPGNHDGRSTANLIILSLRHGDWDAAADLIEREGAK